MRPRLRTGFSQVLKESRRFRLKQKRWTAPFPSDSALKGQPQHLANNAANVPKEPGTSLEIPAPVTVYPVVAKLFDQRTRGSKVGGTICSSKICKVAEQADSASNVVPSVFLGMHPLDVPFDLWS
jgi:hypothetical protein